MGTWIEDKHSAGSVLRVKSEKTLLNRRTKYQRIKVVDTYDYGRVLLLDDVIMLSEADYLFYHEMMVHVPLYTHPNPEKILIAGGGDGGVATEVLRHCCVKEVTLVEIDSRVPEICKKYFPRTAKGLSDSRCDLVTQDGNKFIKASKSGNYDIIIVDSTDPNEYSRSLYKPQFVKDCFRTLKPDGILVQQVGSPFYSKEIIRTLHKVSSKIFPISLVYLVFVPTYSNGIFSLLISSKKYDPRKHFAKKRFSADRLQMKYYNASIHMASFALPNYLSKI